MSRWTHAMCEEDWIARNSTYGDNGELVSIARPVRISSDDIDAVLCCFCFKPTISGIFVRHNPDELSCNGDHGEAVDS